MRPLVWPPRRERFACAQRAGDLPKSADPAALALYLVTMANGMCVQASAGASRQDLQATVNIALAARPVDDPRKGASKRKSSEAAQ